MPVEAKREQNNSLKAQNTAQSQKSKKGFQPKKKQHTTVSQKPPGVKRLRGKGKYYKAFGIDMRAASAHLPDNEGAYGYVEKDSLLTCLDPVAGLFSQEICLGNAFVICGYIFGQQILSLLKNMVCLLLWLKN